MRDLKYQLEKRVFQNESLKQQMSSIENSLLNMCENGGDDVSINLSSSQQSFGKEQKANDDLIESQWDTNEFSQSQRHAKKVQMRMRNLEKCIQNLNITTWPSEDSISRGGRYSPDIDYKVTQKQSLEKDLYQIF